MKKKRLLLLYESSGPIGIGDLVSWTEHSNASVFRRDVVRPAHRLGFIDFDETAQLVRLSPVGETFVEDNLSLTL